MCLRVEWSSSAYVNMDEFDENGWAHVHHAAYNGYYKSVSRFIKSREDQLELETQDGQQLTPFLLACMNGHVDTVQLLAEELGANLKAKDRKLFGAVELAALKDHIGVLEYLLKLDSPDLEVWKNLIRGLSVSDLETSCAKALVELTSEGNSDHLESFLNAGGVQALLGLLKNSLSSVESNIFALSVLLNLVKDERGKEQLSKSKAVPPIILQLTDTPRDVYLPATRLLEALAYNDDNKEATVNNGGIESLVRLLQHTEDEEVVESALSTLRVLSISNSEVQATVGSNNEIWNSLVSLLTTVKNKHVLAAVAKTVGAIVKGNMANQNAFVAKNGVQPLMELMRLRSRECQFASVEGIHALAEGNEDNQRIVTEHGCVMMLMRLLKRSRAADLRTLTAGALWAIAGEKNAQRRSIAAEIGINLLIEFLSENLPQSLHFIGSEALGVLAEGVRNKRDEIAQANGVMPLVRLLGKSNTPAYIILSVLQTLRALCLCLSFRPHIQNQDAVTREGGLKFLIRYMVQARQDIIKAEAAYTLGCVCLRNSTNMKATLDHKDFSFVHILRQLYDDDEEVHLLAGAALSVFAYNNVANQRNIAVSGGVRYHSFVPFLEQKNERLATYTAFQVVVLSRIIPDEDQSLTSATGIKMLVSLLDSTTEDIQCAATNFIGGLAHSRAGIPGAIISIGTIPILGKLLTSQYETVQAAAAVALGYLSYDSIGERQLLSLCRHDPFLYEVIQFHAGKVKLSRQFVERWQHCKRIGLPPIMKKPDPFLSVGQKMVTAHFALDAEQTFTVANTNDSPVVASDGLPERKLSATTSMRTGTILRLPIA